MRTIRRTRIRIGMVLALILTLTSASTRLRAQSIPEEAGMCGGASINLPFTDVSSGSAFFCSIASAYFTGLTNGTTATTYTPGGNVTREQMAAFVTRTMDQTLRRGGQRASLDQFWTTQTISNLALTTVGSSPRIVKSDGKDLWVANNNSNTVSRVRSSDGRLIETWNNANGAFGVLVAMGKVFVTGATIPGSLYQIDPAQAMSGAVTTLSTVLGSNPGQIAFDGQRIWTANVGQMGGGSVSIVTLNPITVTNLTTGFNQPAGILYDGTNIWVTDLGDNTLKRLDANGAVLLSVSMGNGAIPQYPAFDGSNIWVPNVLTQSVVVVRATGGFTGTVLATLSGNGLSSPVAAAFDGERILVTNNLGNSISMWKASDLTPIGTFATGADTRPFGACSDGTNFWVALAEANKLARF